MTHGRSILLLAALAVAGASSALGQTMSRDEVAGALLRAEGLRQSFRIQYEPVFNEGQRPAPANRAVITRLVDGQGRFRQETVRAPNSRNPDPIMQLETWDGTLSCQEFYALSQEPNGRHNVMLTDEAPDINLIDSLGPSLGIRCPHSDKSIGQVLSDPEVPAEIHDIELDGRPMVEVTITGAPFMPTAVLVLRYDPQRQWVVCEWELSAYGREKDKPFTEGTKYFHSKIVVSDFKQVGDVWMAGRFDNFTTFNPGAPAEQNYHQVTLINSIELNPKWTDADFSVDLASLPPHSQIADARWGGTYRLGEDVVLMSGRLNKVQQVVNAPIDPAHFDEVMLGSTPIVDPSLLASTSMTSTRTVSEWLRLTGYIMVAAGAVGAVVLFFRHRFSGS